MSSIDRAMEKFVGDGEDEEEKSARATVAPDTAAGQTATPASDADVAPAPRSEPDPEPDALPYGPPAESPIDHADAVDRAHALPDEPPPVVPSRPGADTPTGDYVVLDVERLKAAGMLVPDQPTTREAEEYQQIKRRLLGNLVPGIMNHERPPNLILITSSVPGEGKTFTSVNLAISIALEVDHTVLVIDSDIVKCDMSKVFGVNGRKGLFDLLADPTLRLEDMLVRTSMPNLVVLPAGSRTEGSTELLASLRMQALADEIAIRYADRVVIFDSPPILASTTATALAPLMGQILMVAEAGKTKQETVNEAIQRLDRVQITGFILNKSKQMPVKGYDYYGYYYPGVR
ncbi:MAG: XrtA-associated tyrosine autokinase [Gammaproteobacteria bacterium]|nr:XrtA-associated tyrosine autokinase [Gammaproteobacteria bacterium]